MWVKAQCLPLQEHSSSIRAVFVFCDNHRVMSAEQEGFIHIWRAEDGEGLLSLMGPVDLLQVSPSSQLGVSGNRGDHR